MKRSTKRQFCIYPSRDNMALPAQQSYMLANQYWQVEIFKHKQQFLRRYRDITHPDARMDMEYCEAIVCPRTRYRADMQLDNRLGLVLFLQMSLTPEIIAHEAVHQATHFIRVNRISSLKLTEEIDEREETLAYTIGNCVQQFYYNLGPSIMLIRN